MINDDVPWDEDEERVAEEDEDEREDMRLRMSMRMRRRRMEGEIPGAGTVARAIAVSICSTEVTGVSRVNRFCTAGEVRQRTRDRMSETDETDQGEETINKHMT